MKDKFFKKSFGSKNFLTAQASNGVYVRLISSSLSKKGNWVPIFKNFLDRSLKFRQICFFNYLTNFKLSKKSRHKINIFRLTKTKLYNFKKLASLILLKSGNRLVIFNNQSFFLSTTNNKQNELSSFSSLKSIHSLFKNILVSIELKSKRRGGRVFLVPVPVKSEKRRHSIFIRWFKKSLLDSSSVSIGKNINDELNQFFLGKGKSMDRLLELDKSIKLNRVFLRKSQIKLI